MTYTMHRISRTFFKGLMAIIPLVITLYLLFWLAGTAEAALGKIFKFFFPDRWYIKGFGFALGLGIVFFMGTFLESQTFRRLFERMETLVMQVPLVRTIYTATSDFLALFSKNRGQFKQVVLVRSTHAGIGWQVGFVTVPDITELCCEALENDQIAVFLPFSYQMGGITVFVHQDDLINLDMTVEDALRFIATAGIVRTTDTDKSND